MSITIHYIDEMFNLYACTLHVKPVEEANHTAEMVLEEFNKGLAVFKGIGGHVPTDHRGLR
jgi:hypothetical protein